MPWWTLHYLSNTRSWNVLHTTAFTSVSDHLFMAWSHYKPSRSPIYKTVRGKIVFCGYKYIWDTPVITEQNVPGNTPWHYFYLTNLEPDAHIWYYLFSIEGPYGRECQGPLIHIMPPQVHLWTPRLYVGTRAKGIYYTYTFTGPGGDHPLWKTLNGGLFSLAIHQLQPDPFDAATRHYCLAGTGFDRFLYKRVPPIAPGWVPILSIPEARDLTRTTGGAFCWVTTNINHPAYLYVLYTGTKAGNNQVFLLRSPDYGDTWLAHEIYVGNAYNAGCLQAGIVQGTSEHPPGDVLYATINHYVGGRSYIYRSFDNGTTWSYGGYTGIMIATHNCLVDPSDQAIVYMGGFGSGYFPRRLYRSTDHGATWVNISDNQKLGTYITPYTANLWVDPTDPAFLRVMQDEHLWTSPDAGANWDDWGITDELTHRHTALWENPGRLYLAKAVSGTSPPVGPNNHVIFVSDDHGIHMEGKAGDHPYFVDGGGDSIPFNCGGVCLQGMMLFPPY